MMITKQTAVKVNQLISKLCDDVTSSSNPEQLESIARLIEALNGCSLDTVSVVGYRAGFQKEDDEG